MSKGYMKTQITSVMSDIQADPEPLFSYQAEVFDIKPGIVVEEVIVKYRVEAPAPREEK